MTAAVFAARPTAAPMTTAAAKTSTNDTTPLDLNPLKLNPAWQTYEPARSPSERCGGGSAFRDELLRLLHADLAALAESQRPQPRIGIVRRVASVPVRQAAKLRRSAGKRAATIAAETRSAVADIRWGWTYITHRCTRVAAAALALMLAGCTLKG